MKIKVCGMCYPHHIAEVAALRPDYMGFIFYEKSPRYAGHLAPEVVHTLPESICKVGVFVDAPFDEILATVRKYRLDMVQLHGNESPSLCSSLAGTCPVIKAIAVHPADDIRKAAAKYNGVDFLLFDTKTTLHGGSGQQFDWSVLESYDGKTPFFLSGGIGPGDTSRLKALEYPLLRAIDINSRFETKSGVKDVQLLKSFLEEINN